jgi:hypothetical protein
VVLVAVGAFSQAIDINAKAQAISPKRMDALVICFPFE